MRTGHSQVPPRLCPSSRSVTNLRQDTSMCCGLRAPPIILSAQIGRQNSLRSRRKSHVIAGYCEDFQREMTNCVVQVAWSRIVRGALKYHCNSLSANHEFRTAKGLGYIRGRPLPKNRRSLIATRRNGWQFCSWDLAVFSGCFSETTIYTLLVSVFFGFIFTTASVDPPRDWTDSGPLQTLFQLFFCMFSRNA